MLPITIALLRMFEWAVLPRMATMTSLRIKIFCFTSDWKPNTCVVLLPNTGTSAPATNFGLTSRTILQGASIARASQWRNHYPSTTTMTVPQIPQLWSLQSMNIVNVCRMSLQTRSAMRKSTPFVDVVTACMPVVHHLVMVSLCLLWKPDHCTWRFIHFEFVHPV